MQSREEWHKRRKSGLGSSDAAVVLGLSPWKTRFELWQEKTGEAEPTETNFAMQRGIELEPIARAQYELEHNIDMSPKEMEHPKLPFIRANLDGYNADNGGLVLEIKAPGAADHKLATMGMVPEKYYPQLQHQLLVSGARKAHYYSFDGAKGALVEVARDEEFISKLQVELEVFWDLVQHKIPPAITSKDYKTVESKETIDLIEQWQAAKVRLDKAAEVEKDLKTKLVKKLEGHSRWKYNGVVMFKSVKQGNVEYNKIPALAGIDLDQYRGKGSEYWTVKGKKDAKE